MAFLTDDIFISFLTPKQFRDVELLVARPCLLVAIHPLCRHLKEGPYHLSPDYWNGFLTHLCPHLLSSALPVTHFHGGISNALNI